ncbi:PrsW family intramembrane metalloprotease, partial [Candidatus Azambacteria bacterium]|nr:PrsW family intramembrane metalloprotease [Candidatus Azambacteria bacterium]
MNNLYLTSFSNVAYLVLLGVAPSIVWLWYFLRKDDNPEPKKMILKVFVFGFFSTFVAFTLEWALIKAVTDWKLACLHCESAIPYFPQTWGATWAALLFSFAVLASLAFIEEWVKYIAAKAQIIRSAYFDEPVDAMIYLIVAALGFAAAEN